MMLLHTRQQLIIGTLCLQWFIVSCRVLLLNGNGFLLSAKKMLLNYNFSLQCVHCLCAHVCVCARACVCVCVCVPVYGCVYMHAHNVCVQRCEHKWLNLYL